MPTRNRRFLEDVRPMLYASSWHPTYNFSDDIRDYELAIHDANSEVREREARRLFGDLIKTVENSKDNPKGGYDKAKKIWRPHASYEGGPETIAYGIKLQDKIGDTLRAQYVRKALEQGYLTDEQANSAVGALAYEYREGAKDIYDRRYGKGSFDRLAPEQQAVATDIQYNGGLGNFKEFMKALHDNDVRAQIKESKRNSNGKPLGRNKHIADLLNSQLPYIGRDFAFKNGGGINVKFKNDNYHQKMIEVGKQNYKRWGFKTPEEATRYAINDRTYDYEGYYDKYPESSANSETHWTDEFKTVYHPTFSDESIYHGKIHPKHNPYGLRGGHWIGDVYQPHIGIPRKHLKTGGGIHIKPENRGKFTATMKRTGKTAEELSHSSNPLTRKRAIFALNARKWHH